MSKGILQHDMWKVEPPSTRWDWDGLRSDIARHGVRNSLLLAPMPTASTSQILGRAGGGGCMGDSMPFHYCHNPRCSPWPHPTRGGPC